MLAGMGKTPKKDRKRDSPPAWRRSLKNLRAAVYEGRDVLKESSPALAISLIADIVVGITLVGFAHLLLDLPGVLIMIPGALAARGNIYATLASRLSTALHLGEIEPSLRMGDRLKGSLKASLVQTLTVSASLAFFARAVTLLFNLPSISLLKLLFISLVGTALSAAVLLAATTLITLGSFRKGWDPDNISSPLITTIGDLITLPSLVASVYFLLYIGDLMAEALALVLVIAATLLYLNTLKEKSHAGRILSDSLPILLLCALISTVTGTLLSNRAEGLIGYSIFLLLLPLFNGQSGNLGSILSSRLSTAYYLGLTSLKKKIDSYSRREILLVVLLSFIVFPASGALALALSLIFPLSHPGVLLTMALVVFIGFILGVEASSLSYAFSHLSVRFSLNPDNVVIPLLTTFMDLMVMGTLVAVLAAAGLI